MTSASRIFLVNKNRKDQPFGRPAFRLVFSSAGARTRTWSLLVRSQTLYPVGLHPRFVLLSSLVDGSKYRIIENNVKGKVQKK